jgi:hypothetical protein
MDAEFPLQPVLRWHAFPDTARLSWVRVADWTFLLNLSRSSYAVEPDAYAATANVFFLLQEDVVFRPETNWFSAQLYPYASLTRVRVSAQASKGSTPVPLMQAAQQASREAILRFVQNQMGQDAYVLWLLAQAHED